MGYSTMVIKFAPNFLAASLTEAVAQYRRGEFSKAEVICKRLVLSNPQNFDVLYLAGTIASSQGNLSRADGLLQRAATIRPESAALHSDHGVVLQRLGRLSDAVACYKKAIEIDPRHLPAQLNCGIAHNQLGHYGEALGSFEAALLIRPDLFAAWNGKGLALKNLCSFEAALSAFEKAIALNPSFTEGYYNLGNLYQTQLEFRTAIEFYNKAIAANPNDPDLLCNMGSALCKLGRETEALDYFNNAIRLMPLHAQALSNRGILLVDQQSFEDAMPSLDQAYLIQPDIDFLLSSLIRTKMSLCDWDGIDSLIDKLEHEISEARIASNPLVVLSLVDSPALQKKAAETYVRRIYPSNQTLGIIGPRPGYKKIRIGYISADFNEHPVGQLMAGVIEQHDKSRFETIGISLGVDDQSALRGRFMSSFDKFIDARLMGTLELTSLIRSFEVDVAVNLGGFTLNARTDLFASRVAPIQVNFLGYPGTMGADYMDYIIADKCVITEADSVFYDERIAWLPDTYLPTDSNLAVSESTPSRVDAGLPATGFVFCSFGNLYKLNPRLFGVWMQLLSAVDGSVLWLSTPDPQALNNLRLEAQRQGVNPERLVFADRVPLLEDHLARYRLADLFLDTTPYNAHTTAADALFVGLPVITCLGKTFPGKVASSLLQAIGMSMLVTESLEHYAQLALELSQDPVRLKGLKKKIIENKGLFPLFQTSQYCRHLEEALSTMMDQHQAGHGPSNFSVERKVPSH